MKSSRFYYSLIALFVFQAVVVYADDSIRQTNELQPTELFVFGSYRATENQPFTFSNVLISDIKQSLYGQEASTTLSKLPAINNYSDSGAGQGYSYFRLRGIDQTRINITLDGVPLNEPEDQGAYLSNYPDLLSSLNRYQVIRGVGTTQNGIASYGGSVVLESKDLSDAASTTTSLGAGSFDTTRESIEYNSGIQDNYGLYLRAAELDTSGYKLHSGNSSRSLYYKAGKYLNHDKWFISGFVGQQANELAWIGSTLEEISIDRRHNANTSREDDEFLQNLTQLQNIHSFGAGSNLSSSIYYGHLEGNYNFDLNNFLGLPQTAELLNYNFNSNTVGAFSSYKQKIEQTELTLSAHANMYERKHLGRELRQGTLYENTGHKNEHSLAAKVEQRVSDWLLLADVQARHVSFDYAGYVDMPVLNWNFINPKIGATYLINSRNNLYYSFGRGGREPTRSDIFLGNEDLQAGPDGKALTGATQAEHVNDHELGIRHLEATWSANANVYYMNFDKEIVLNGKVGSNSLPLTDSVDDSYRSGLEFEFKWSPTAKLELSSNASFNHSQIKEADLEFRPVMTPQWIANQGVQYKIQHINLGADLRYQSASYIDFANSKKVSGHFVADLNAQYSFRDFELGLHINNIFNEKYLSNGYVDFAGQGRYFAQAPSNIFATITWKL